MEVSEKTLLRWVSSLARDNYAPAGKVYNELRTMLKMHGTGRPQKLEENDGKAYEGDIVAYTYEKRSDYVPVEIIEYWIGADEIYKCRHSLKTVVLMRASEVKRRIEEAGE